jgi:type VI secretion system protein VasG
MGLLQAGASVKGEFENRLKNVIDEVNKSPHSIIFFIGEAHTMIGAAGQAAQKKLESQADQAGDLLPLR